MCLYVRWRKQRNRRSNKSNDRNSQPANSFFVILVFICLSQDEDFHPFPFHSLPTLLYKTLKEKSSILLNLRPSKTSEHTCFLGNSSGRRFQFRARAAQHGFCCSLMFTKDKQDQIGRNLQSKFTNLFVFHKRQKSEESCVPPTVDRLCPQLHQRQEEETLVWYIIFTVLESNPHLCFPVGIYCTSADTSGTSRVWLETKKSPIYSWAQAVSL